MVRRVASRSRWSVADGSGHVQQHPADRFRYQPVHFQVIPKTKPVKGVRMRTLVVFISGIVIGSVIQIAGAQRPASQPNVRLNHVAISVPDMNEALKYYGDKLGFHEVVRNTNQQGQLQSAYIQISRDTFIELQQSNAQR